MGKCCAPSSKGSAPFARCASGRAKRSAAGTKIERRQEIGRSALQRRARWNPAIVVILHKLCCTTHTALKPSATVPLVDAVETVFDRPERLEGDVRPTHRLGRGGTDVRVEVADEDSVGALNSLEAGRRIEPERPVVIDGGQRQG